MDTGKILLFQSLRNGGSLGRYNVPGLPDVVAGWSNMQVYRDQEATIGFSGALEGHPVANAMVLGSGHYGWDSVVFKASRSNSEYGAQSTVMPASVDITMGLYLGNTA